MSRRSIATPCPTSTSHEASYMKSLDETTTTLNFTTAFDSSFRQIKPRRKQRLSVQFAIHEDAETAQHAEHTLSKPARRISGAFTQLQMNQDPQDMSECTIDSKRNGASRLSQAPRRPQNRLSIVPEGAPTEDETMPGEVTKMLNLTINAARPVRRGTIYIPNEDTTMPSMYMGIFSPVKEYEPVPRQTSEPTAELTGLVAQIAVKRGKGRRTSMIDAAPRRAPLQTSSRKLQAPTFPLDRPGQGGGKENLLPEISECEKQMLDLNLIGSPSLASSRSSPSQTQHNPDTRRLRTSIYKPIASVTERNKARMSLPTSSYQLITHNQSRRQWNMDTQNRPPPVARPQHMVKVSASAVSETMRLKPRVPSRFVVPTIQHEPMTSINTILTEDIATPMLYEENWLGHQEIAITQLVNKLFTAAQPAYHRGGMASTLTQELVALYNTTSNAVLHNRIQAALLYGALSIPQEILNQSETFAKDVGRRQHFINLWINTYNRDALEAALETVVGRRCRRKSAQQTTCDSPATTPTKKALHNFIDIFLLRNEDARPDRTVRDRTAWSYQRTMLRSLMLIKILDTIKTSASTSFSSALFLSSSRFKSSIAVLQRLFQMMNPAAGDPMRPLNHIDYNVSHDQYPLEEFQYNIGNLAVDLRDGIRLTRMIELLLYPSASYALAKNSDVDATTTIMMPAGTSVDFRNGQDWPLSQHLKFPCQSRVARLWNVQIALSAAARVKGMETMVEGISAEDIVDGFREKTIRLLWALVGKCGLASLINWDDVKWEIRRLRLRSTISSIDYFEPDDVDESPASRTFESCKGLLKSWVRAVAASQGIEIRNFTTSFADGKVFEAIVDSYEQFLTPADTANKQQTSRHGSLSDRLRNLGCSKQFADLFCTSETTHIFDRDFVLATLAFLCSRLLTPSKNARAATVIQTAWRQHWAKVQCKRNERRKLIATECAEHVLMKNSTHVLQRERMQHVSEPVESESQSQTELLIHSPMSDVGSGDIWLSL